MKNGSSIFHRISEIDFNGRSRNGMLWIDITITDNEGSAHVVTCCAYNEMPKITVTDHLKGSKE